jgi:hypothetical protein
MPKYNGHKNWNHWNVSLWINNDQGLYLHALVLIRGGKFTKDAAAARMLSNLHAMGISKTPDGAPYSKSAIRAAMVEM